MKRKSDVQKSCGPQLFDKTLPAHDWPLEELTEFAQREYRKIVDDEKTLALAYWRLGNALTVARKQLGRGRWGHFLKSLPIDKTRSSKACAVFRAFSSPEQLKELTVEQAYKARRQHHKKQEPVAGAAAAEAAVLFAKSLTKSDQAAAEAIQLAEQLTSEEKREFWEQVVRAIARLQAIESQLAAALQMPPLADVDWK